MLPVITDNGGLPGLALTEVLASALGFLFAILRVGAFAISAPIFSARFVPLPVRIIISVGLGVAVAARVQMPPPQDLGGIAALPMVLVEISIGLAAGLILQLLFASAAMAGDRIANAAGLGLAAQVDPATGAQTPVIGQFFQLFLMVLFVAEDGHLIAVRLLIESYEVVGPGAAFDPAAMMTAGLSVVAPMFTNAVRLMMPVVSVLLILNGVIGVITRSAPQLNIFAFGFPLTMTVSIAVLFITAPMLAPTMSDMIAEALAAVGAMIEGLADG